MEKQEDSSNGGSVVVITSQENSNSSQVTPDNASSVDNNVQMVEQMETPDAVVKETPQRMDISEISSVDLVTPKMTGKALKVHGRKKAVRTAKPKITFKKSRYPLRDLENKHKPGEHPSYKEMVDEAIFNSDSRKGVSRAAIKNYILDKYPVGDRLKMINTNIRKAINNLIAKEELTVVEEEGKRANRFRLAPEVKNKMKKAKAKADKEEAKTPQGKPKSDGTPKTGSGKKRQVTPQKKANTGTPKAESGKKRKATPSKAKETPAKKAKTTPAKKAKETSAKKSKETSAKKTKVTPAKKAKEAPAKAAKKSGRKPAEAKVVPAKKRAAPSVVVSKAKASKSQPAHIRASAYKKPGAKKSSKA